MTATGTDLNGLIDALYKLPPAEFTAARNALAKTLAGEAAKHVRTLAKPTVVPWAANQVFWHARSAYDKVLERGTALRTAQLASLKGQKADVRGAAEAHRKAIADAVRRARELAGKQNVKPDGDALTRLFEALSLAPQHPETPGRLTEILQPAGFESLAGIAIAKPRAVPVSPAAPPSSPPPSAKKVAEEERRAERERKIAEEEVGRAAREVERAKTLESAARRDVERATFAVRRAEEALAAARKKLVDLA